MRPVYNLVEQLTNGSMVYNQAVTYICTNASWDQPTLQG